MMAFSRRNQNDELRLTVSTATLVKVIITIIGTILLLAALRKATHALTLVFIAFFLALALDGPVHWISRHLPGRSRGSRVMATTVSYLVVVLILGAFIASLVPPLIKQTQSFVNAAPSLIKNLRSQDSETGTFIRRYNLDDQINSFSTQLSERLNNAGSSAFSTVSKIGSSIFSMLTILALTFMMLVEGPRWISFFRRLVPRPRRKDVDRLAADMYRVVKGYVNGQVTLAAIAALFLLPALLILDVSYPIALVFVVFICGLIPMVGHTLGAAIVTAVALFTSLPHALIILAYYILYQQIENYLIQPRIQANSTNLSPLLVFVAVVIGVSFSGLLGGLVAIPVMGCLRIIMLYYLQERDLISKEELKQTLEPS